MRNSLVNRVKIKVHKVFVRLGWINDKKTIDYYLISYPKCGRTWLRMMIGKIYDANLNLELRESELTEIQYFHKIDAGIPQFSVIHDDNPHLKPVIELSSDKSKYDNSHVIFLYRNPIDVIVSLYNHYKFFPFENNFIEKKISESESIDQFVLDEEFGIESVLTYYNAWGEWLGNNKDRSIIVSYENLLRHTDKEVLRIDKFLDLHSSLSIRSSAIEFSSFENMQKMESAGVLNPKRFAQDGTSRKVNVNQRKNRIEYETRNMLEVRVGEKLHPTFAKINGQHSKKTSK